MPTFTYLSSPIVVSGVTALNPDVLDLYVEEVKGDTFLASNGDWQEMHVTEEIIKVRLGFDVPFKVKFTANGVVLPPDLLDGKAKQMNWYIVPDFWKDNQLYSEGKVYTLASALDPTYLEIAGIKSKPSDNYRSL